MHPFRNTPLGGHRICCNLRIPYGTQDSKGPLRHLPPLALPWKPGEIPDRRREVTDFGVGNLTLNGPPYFKLRIGAEVKRALPIMTDLPAPSAIEDGIEVKSAFHDLYFQGEDQAKAAIKGGFNFPNRPQVPFFLFVGPYWTSVSYGPFSEAKLTVRTHKPSASADWKETSRAMLRLKSNPSRRTLHLLGTTQSAIAMGQVIATTDGYAAPLRAAAKIFQGKFSFISPPLSNYDLRGVWGDSKWSSIFLNLLSLLQISFLPNKCELDTWESLVTVVTYNV